MDLDIFDAKAIDPWQSPVVVQPIVRPDFADNEQLKQAFGIELGKGKNSFDAGVEVLKDTAKGLWASTHWMNDPLVHAAKDVYLKSLKLVEKPLDKEELLAEVLASAKLAPDFKDKASLFKLYSDIAGFTGKQGEVNPVFNNNTTNVMQIKLVGGSEKSEIIDAAPTNHKSKMQNDENSIPKLKLVGGSR